MMYSVSLLFHTSPSDDPQTHQLWEDRILLISADSDEEAKEKAEAIGRKHEFEYMNALGFMVTVKLERAESACLIDGELLDGCELFSRFLSDTEARSILKPFTD